MGLGLKILPLLAAEAAKRVGGRPHRDKEKLSPQTGEVLSAAGKAAEHAAETVKVGSRAIEEMATEAKENAEVVEDLVRGKTTVKATRKKRRTRKQKEKHEEAIAKIDPSSKLWTLTDSQKVILCQAVVTDPPYGILKEPWEPARLAVRYR